MVRSVYTALVCVVIVQRLLEMRISRRHEAQLRARGGIEAAAGQLPIMIAIHTGWLAACLAEAWLRSWPLVWPLALLGFLVFAAGQLLRLLAMLALGERWTVRVILLPEAAPVQAGIFRYLRHPNYLGVILEFAGLPLLGGAYGTALLFSAANAALLFWRIHAEERALNANGPYLAALGDRPRFVPRAAQLLAALGRARRSDA